MKLIKQDELIIKKSKFIGYYYDLDNVEEVKDILNILKKEHKKAKHIVYAYKYLKGKNMSLKKISFPYYRVREGENLKVVAEKFGVDSTKILLDNNLSPKQVREGIFIKISKN